MDQPFAPAIRYCFALLMLLFTAQVKAQPFTPDTVIYKTALKNTLGLDQSISTKTFGLFTGSQYVRDYYGVKGHPFFLEDTLHPGSVEYNGIGYENILLEYDLSHDNVITRYDDNTRLVLVPEKVDHFNIDGHSFVRLNADAPEGEGFYDLLVDGKVQLIAKRVKKLAPWIKTQEYNAMFVEETSYYLHRPGAFIRLSGKRDIVKALADKTIEIKEFIAKARPQFRKSFESGVVATLIYYNGLAQ